MYYARSGDIINLSICHNLNTDVSSKLHADLSLSYKYLQNR